MIALVGDMPRTRSPSGRCHSMTADGSAVPSRAMQTGRLAIIGGHSILGSQYASRRAARRRRLEAAARSRRSTAGTTSCCSATDSTATHPRTSCATSTISPRSRALGCDRVLALSSVGGLRPDVGVGTLPRARRLHRAAHVGVVVRRRAWASCARLRSPSGERASSTRGRDAGGRRAPRRRRLLADLRARASRRRPRSATSRGSPTSSA